MLYRAYLRLTLAISKSLQIAKVVASPEIRASKVNTRLPSLPNISRPCSNGAREGGLSPHESHLISAPKVFGIGYRM